MKRGYKRILMVLTFMASIGFYGCQKDPELGDEEVFKCATPYELDIRGNFPPLQIPKENPLTVEGVELGRHLFYDPILSGDNTQSCASCHQQNASFVDRNKRLSVGILGQEGFRNSMPLHNLAFAQRYFWDGTSRSLEELIAVPIENDFEMHENIFNAVKELQESERYPGMFAEAFCDSTVNVERISYAIAQFLRTIIAYAPQVSSEPSVRLPNLNAQQLAGLEVYLDETKGDCFHCHTLSLPNTTLTFENNGLVQKLEPNTGLAGVTGNPDDIGKFKVPSLINIRYTAPYMHDGRFKTLPEVLDFYDTGFHYSATLNPNLKKHYDLDNDKHIPRAWSQQDKNNLLAFLFAIQDTTIMSNPDFARPE
jgi:cytochrome c peroxidase